MPEGHEALVGRLFNAFNQRDAAEIVALCSPRMEFFAVTAEEVGRGAPYVGPDGRGSASSPRRNRSATGGRS